MKKIKKIKITILPSLLISLMLLFAACSSLTEPVNETGMPGMPNAAEAEAETETSAQSFTMAINENLTKTTDIRPGYGTMYEVFVYSFYDSDGDGIGDFNGLTSQLDYISDLGFDGIWLMPIKPSPTYHKYDVTDYYGIDPEYGTMADFENFIEACDERGIRVIIDLVLNHSSSQHPWFLKATEYLAGLDGKEPDILECPEFGFYHFTQERKSNHYQVAGTEDWYYEGHFWSEMPDLNLDNLDLRVEIENIAAFWLQKGVAGFRLDAVKEFFTGALEKNIEVLTWFNQMVKDKNPDAYLVAEVWDNAITYAPYLRSGIDSIFNFAFANHNGTIAETVRGRIAASNFPAAIISHNELLSSYNPDFIDAPFYTNHDLGRSAGYYNGEFALAQTKMALALNLLMSGNTFTYYGDELGMNGSGIDENKRLAMYWSEDENAPGMCRGPLDKDNVKFRYESYETQKDDPYSIYNFSKNALKIRNAFPAVIQGNIKNLDEIGTDSLLAFTKTDGESHIVILANLSPDEIEIKTALIGDINIAAVLLTNESPVLLDFDNLCLPAYSIVILEQEN
ncbi:MAG: alpha-amylase family glycosyl hydrolase [Lachnospiraceae bacterium]|nr:alpha-amylase family glycosyl hydrolase [Lachnospiraceae bacterium]